jgi:predicted RNA-binding Zn ribbon-like protein
LHRLLWPIAESAAELLTSQEVSSIRLCEAPDCDWLFLDNSRNRSRRWCDMKICGNREKARRHYRRSRP